MSTSVMLCADAASAAALVSSGSGADGEACCASTAVPVVRFTTCEGVMGTVELVVVLLIAGTVNSCELDAEVMAVRARELLCTVA